MELKLRNGDYVADGMGGLQRVSGREELLQRVLFRLIARRGMFPFLENLGSRVLKNGQLAEVDRELAAKQYVVEALEDERELQVQTVVLSPGMDGSANLTVGMEWQGESLAATVKIQT